MVNFMKTPPNRKLLYTFLLALSLPFYTISSFAVDTTASLPVLPTLSESPVSTPAPPNTTNSIIAESIKTNIANIAWQKEATAEIYRLSGYNLIWVNKNHTEEALKLLASSPADKGFHSEDYNTSWLNAHWQKIKATTTPSFEELVVFDTTLSSSLLSYYSDVRYGRVNPKKVSFDFNVNKEHLKLAQSTFKVAKEGSLATLADTLESKLIFYRKLKQALNQYQQAAHDLKDLHFKFSPALKSGQSNPQIIALRQLLSTLGDMPKKSDHENSTVYDADLVAAVKNFQQRHGLAAKGVLNKNTVSALNVPLEERIAKIELSLERWRWVPEPTEDRMIVVNIPSFQLWAFDSLKDAESKPLTMRVVVGKAPKQKTPSLSSVMDYVDFRPTWSVPQSIIKNEMMSKLQNNPGYFSKRNMKVTYHDGHISIRQASGDHNALGLVKFLFPNNHSVYLHDTPMKSFFSQSRRDFSHGCVRLGEPELLAQYVLKPQTGNWTAEKVKKAMHKGGNKRVALEHPIPIVIFYGTAIVLDNKGVAFFQDVYGHDKTLKQTLVQMQSKNKKVS